MTMKFMHMTALMAFAAFMLNAPQTRAEALSPAEFAEMQAEQLAVLAKHDAGRPCGEQAGSKQ